MKTSEKKVEQINYPLFLNFLQKVFKDFIINDYYETADFPEFIKNKLINASKNKERKGVGKPDAIFHLRNNSKTYMFVFEAKSNNIEKATKEAVHYTKFLEDITSNLFQCSLDKEHLKIIHYKTGKELPIKSMNQLVATNSEDFLVYLEQVNKVFEESVKESERKNHLLNIIRTLNSSLREVGLSGQDRIDFASSLFLVKEIYDAVDQDFKNMYFGTILHSKSLLATLEQINKIATLKDIKNIFPDMSHLIIDNQLINLEKFNKVIAKNEKENSTKAESTGEILNEKIKALLKNEVINLTKTDFDFRGLIVEEFTHGNKGGGVSKEYGEFFTPRHIIKLIVDLAQLKTGDKVFDPAFGTGGFLIEAFKKLVNLNNGVINEKLKKYTIYGSELHDWNVKAAKASLIALGDGHSNLINTDFINGFRDWTVDKDPESISNELVPNVVLMNPPYSLGGELSEWNFVKKAFDQLLKHTYKDGIERKLLAVLPYETIDKNESSLLHQYSNYMEGYISLPYGVFQKYTDVRTQIIVLNTIPRYKNIMTGKSEPMFIAKVEADGYTLDSFRRPINENDIPMILEKWNEYLNYKDLSRTHLKEIKNIDQKFINKEINEEAYIEIKNKHEELFFNIYKNYKNDLKTSLLEFDRIKEFSHFDKALWSLNELAPTLGEFRIENKTILDYFNIITTKGYFYESENEDLPYIEIGDIELMTTFYSHSDKPKCFNKNSKKEGEIIGGILAEKGDVLISMVRTYRGGFTVLKEKAIVTQSGFLVLRPKGEIEGIELISMLKSELNKFVRYVNYLGNGKTYPKMEKEDFVKMYIDLEFAKKSKELFYQKLLAEINLIFNK